MVSPAPVDAQRAAAASVCSICNTDVSKYKCPGCQAATCSLACVKEHKQQTGCSGKRDKLAFVPMQQFTDSHLMSDYRWLEEVNRVDDNAKRHRPPIPRRELPQHLGSLVHQARLRGVRLLMMPPGMQRRQTNSTRYDPRSRKLFWRLEWRFTAAAAAPAAAAPDAAEAAAGATDAGALQQRQQQQQQVVTVFDGKVDEETLMSTVLARHLDYRQGAGAQALQLREYREAGAEALTVLMKKERCPANAVRFYRLDTSQRLLSQLAGKLIIEYPTLIVLLPGNESSYDIITPEEQQAEQLQQQQHRPGYRQQQGGPPGGPHLHWPPPPPPPPRAPEPKQQQDGQQQREQEDEEEGGRQQQQAPEGSQDQPPAKRQCTKGQPGVAAAGAGSSVAAEAVQAISQPVHQPPPTQQQQAGPPPPQQQRQQQQQKQQQQQQQQPRAQQPKYYYYDPMAGLDEDAADCLAGLEDDWEDEQLALTKPLSAAAAAAGAQSNSGAAAVQADGGDNAVMMQLLGQYHDDNEIDIDGDDE